MRHESAPLCMRHIVLAVTIIALSFKAVSAEQHPVPREHPRLLGSRARLQKLKQLRPEAYERMKAIARKNKDVDRHALLLSRALVSVIENDRKMGRRAIDLAMKLVNGPIRIGHKTFGHDLAQTAIVYDLCYALWTDEERGKFHVYMNKTVDGNVRSERSVFHNGWYGYKNWGIGLAAYATYYENERAKKYIEDMEADFKARAGPALELAGDGGGWAEGYYANYWNYEWVFFCEVARFCEGKDYYEWAPKYFRNRAVASMFEQYPGIREYGSRRSIPIGDGGGRTFGGVRDKVLYCRRILVNRYRDDPRHQVVHAFNETTPTTSVSNYAYKDFLWNDSTVTKGDLKASKLSHISPGAGFVYARSSWDEDATYFFFKCGDRFTAHQHMDVGNFLIYRHEQLVGDGGHYDSFSTSHCVNYYLRTIAHNTLLVFDPDEKRDEYYTKKIGIRSGPVTGNDGGQHAAWPHHNGGTHDVERWNELREQVDIADMLAFEDRQDYVYMAGDATRAYRSTKMKEFTRQIVYLRPGTFIVFDRVTSTKAEFKKTFLLQTMKKPEGQALRWTVTHGKGRLSIQTLLPKNPRVNLAHGDKLYTYDGKTYLPSRDRGPAVECRMEISPPVPSARDLFLHVLTAEDAGAPPAPVAKLQRAGNSVTVKVGATTVQFFVDRVGGTIDVAGRRGDLATKVHRQPRARHPRTTPAVWPRAD